MDLPAIPVVVGAIAIGLVVRALKSDTRIPITIPPTARPLFALLLGALDGVANRLAAGMSWQAAFEFGFLASCTSIAGHDVVIEGARRGKEFILPGLMNPPKRASRASYGEIILPSPPDEREEPEL